MNDNIIKFKKANKSKTRLKVIVSKHFIKENHKEASQFYCLDIRDGDSFHELGNLICEGWEIKDMFSSPFDSEEFHLVLKK